MGGSCCGGSCWSGPPLDVAAAAAASVMKLLLPPPERLFIMTGSRDLMSATTKSKTLFIKYPCLLGILRMRIQGTLDIRHKKSYDPVPFIDLLFAAK